MVYKCTDMMAAVISNAFTLWFILFGCKIGTLSMIEIVTVETTLCFIYEPRLAHGLSIFYQASRMIRSHEGKYICRKGAGKKTNQYRYKLPLS